MVKLNKIIVLQRIITNLKMNKMNFINQRKKPQESREMNVSQHYQQKKNMEETKELKISKEEILNIVEKYGWRYKTSLPVVRTIEFSIHPEPLNLSSSKHILPNASNSMQRERESLMGNKISQFITKNPQIEYYKVNVKVQEISMRLSEVEILPIPQVLFLIKEIIIGFEVLIDIFGMFLPTEKMIAINSKDQWKVWINQDYTLNSKEEVFLPEKQFIHRLLAITEKHAPSTNQSKKLFHQLTTFTHTKDCTFIKVLQKINDFILMNKILPVNKVTITTDKYKFKPKQSIIQNHKITEVKDHLKKLTTNAFGANTQLNYNLLGKQQQYQNKNISYTPANSKSFSNLPAMSSLKSHEFFSTSINANQNSKNVSNAPRLNVSSYQYNEKAQLNYSNMISPSKIYNNSPGQSWNLSKTNEKDQGCHSQHNFVNKTTINQTPLKSEQKYIHNQKIHYDEIYTPKSIIAKRKIKSSYSKQDYTFQISPVKTKLVDPTTFTQLSSEFNSSFLNVQSISPDKQPVNLNILQKNSSEKVITNHLKFQYQRPYNNLKLMTTEEKIQEKQIPAQKSESPFKKGGMQSFQTNNKFDGSQNNSSSTKQIQKTPQKKETIKEKASQSSYMNLKMNDLNIGRYKNNQSSINYGINVPLNNQDPISQRKDKNMTISHDFKSKNILHTSSQDSMSSENKMLENRWAKKISGLFSDDASIKQLKESVKFRTEDDDRYNKEYLKDVKLDLLQKFGRPVRYSILDEEDNVVPQNYRENEQYKSMQLIEEDLDEAKSYMEHEDKNTKNKNSSNKNKNDDQEEEELFRKFTRPRNQTVQVVNFKREPNHQYIFEQKIGKSPKKQCISEHYSSGSDSEIPSDDEAGLEIEELLNGKRS